MESQLKKQLDLAKELATKQEFKQALEICSSSMGFAGTLAQKIENLALKAEIHKILSEPAFALEAYDAAISMNLELLSQKESDLAKERQATLLWKKAELSRITQNIPSAIEAYNGSLKIYTQLNEKQEQKYDDGVLSNLYGLSLAYREKQNTYHWRTYTRKAISLAENNINNNIQIKALEAFLYGSLGESFENEDYEYAILYWKKSSTIYEDLLKHDQSYFSYLAAAYNNIAVNNKRRFEYDKSASYYFKALDIYLQLNEAEPNIFKPFLAGLYNSLGILFSDMYDKEEAVSHYLSAHVLYSELADVQPDLFMPYLGTIEHNLAVFYDEQNQKEKAIQAYSKAFEIRKKLAKNSPDLFLLDYAITGINMITLYQSIMEENPDQKIATTARNLITEMDEALNKIDKDLPIVAGMKADINYFKAFFSQASDEELRINKTLHESYLKEEEISDLDTNKQKIEWIESDLKLLNKLLIEFPGHQELTERIAQKHTQLAWYLILNNQLEESRVQLNRSLILDLTSIPAKINMAHIHVLQDEFEIAKSLYELALNKNSTNLKDQIHADLIQFSINGIKHPDFEKLKKLISKY